MPDSSVNDREVFANRVPIVDVGALIRGEYVAKNLALLRQTVEQAGFVYVTNHGIPSSLISNVRENARVFFHQPEATKREVSISKHHRGWLAAGGAQMSQDEPSDMKESFIWGATADAERNADHSLRGPNQWSDECVRDMSKHGQAWFECAEGLARSLLTGLAVAYGLDADYFLKSSDRGLSRASCVFYPSERSSSGLTDQFGVGAHTDFGVLTVLSQDSVGGLQVEVSKNEWVDVPPIDDALIINVGDLLHRWTDGRMRSAPHRVVRPTEVDRLSVVFAYDPNPETVIDAAEFRSKGVDGPNAITCGEYLDARFSQAFAYRTEVRRFD